MSHKCEAHRLLDEFLHDLLARWGLRGPDGRMLHAYKCDETEFHELADRLRNYAPELPKAEMPGYQRASADVSDIHFPPIERDPGFESAVRAFALYASEFWRLYLDEAWRERVLRMEKHTPISWLTLLWFVGWDEVYLPEKGTKGRNRTHGDEEEDVRRRREEWEYEFNLEDVLRIKDRKPLYPALYEPLLKAWREYWQVAPVHLPTSIRYLDTFAVQGGAEQALTVELKLGAPHDDKVIYFATTPRDGYGTDTISFKRAAIELDGHLPEYINATFVLRHQQPSELL